MTSLVNYRKTGRLVIAGYAWYKFGQAVEDGSLLGATSWGIVAVEATIGVFYPDPVATVIGAAVTRGALITRGAWLYLLNWAFRNPAPAFTILYIVLLPFAIKERQELAAERGQIGIADYLWQAEAVPNHPERLKIPSIVGSRVF